jgi:hypothetical protein
MARQTITERLCRTTNLAARHLLQDEAAVFGAQGEVREQLEAELARAEAKDMSNRLPKRLHPCDRMAGGHDTVVEQEGIEISAPGGKFPSRGRECHPETCLKSDSSEVQ